MDRPKALDIISALRDGINAHHINFGISEPKRLLVTRQQIFLSSIKGRRMMPVRIKPKHTSNQK